MSATLHPVDHRSLVLAQLPPGTRELPDDITGVRYGWDKEGGVWYYHCPHCGGWLEGLPPIKVVETWRWFGIFGHCGWGHDCPRCGVELFFMGRVGLFP